MNGSDLTRMRGFRDSGSSYGHQGNFPYFVMLSQKLKYSLETPNRPIQRDEVDSILRCFFFIFIFIYLFFFIFFNTKMLFYLCKKNLQMMIRWSYDCLYDGPNIWKYGLYTEM